MQITNTESMGSQMPVHTEDDRRPIQKLRRKEMWALAEMVGLDFPRNARKDIMLPILESAEAMGVNWKDRSTWPKQGQPVSRMNKEQLKQLAASRGLEVPDDATKADILEELQGKAPEKPMDKMNVFQLRAVARDRGREFPKTATKAEIMAWLNGEEPT